MRKQCVWNGSDLKTLSWGCQIDILQTQTPGYILFLETVTFFCLHCDPRLKRWCSLSIPCDLVNLLVTRPPGHLDRPCVHGRVGRPSSTLTDTGSPDTRVMKPNWVKGQMTSPSPARTKVSQQFTQRPPVGGLSHPKPDSKATKLTRTWPSRQHRDLCASAERHHTHLNFSGCQWGSHLIRKTVLFHR